MLGSLLKLAVDVATVPISVVKDVLDAPNILEGSRESSTIKNLEDIVEDILD